MVSQKQIIQGIQDYLQKEWQPRVSYPRPYLRGKGFSSNLAILENQCDLLAKKRLDNTILEPIDRFEAKLTKKLIYRYRQIYKHEQQPIPIYKSSLVVETSLDKIIKVYSSPVDIADFDDFYKLVQLPFRTLDDQLLKSIIKNDLSNPALQKLIDLLDLSAKPYYYYNSDNEKWRIVYITDCQPKNKLSREEAKFLIELLHEMVDYIIDASTKEVVKTFPRARVKTFC